MQLISGDGNRVYNFNSKNEPKIHAVEAVMARLTGLAELDPTGAALARGIEAMLWAYVGPVLYRPWEDNVPPRARS